MAHPILLHTTAVYRKILKTRFTWTIDTQRMNLKQ